mgnify:CR=1 FL=1|tara:strand:- start:530 stop:1000 length:471 start_codon:yes stop_codon:yes gene_type:complete
MDGIKHLIQCHCILPQFRNKPDPLFHKFVVFSVVDDSDTVVPKYVQCNNCAVVHKVYDICKSEIVPGRDELSSVATIDDIKFTIKEDVRTILETYDADLPTWEHVQYIFKNKAWGTTVVLKRDMLEKETQGKILTVNGPTDISIETFITQNWMDKE